MKKRRSAHFRLEEKTHELIEKGAEKTRRSKTGYVEHSVKEQAKRDGV